MNCSCIGDIEKRLASKYSSELGETAAVECLASGFTLGATVEVIHKTEFKITANVPGYKRGKSIPVIASFCPFCGSPAKRAEVKP